MADHLLTQDGNRILLTPGPGTLLLQPPIQQAATPKLYVGSFTLPAGGTLGDQTVTGIVDSSGAPFTPKAVIIWGAWDGKFSGTLNQEEWDSMGVDDGVLHLGQACESRRFAGTNWRGVSVSGAHSIMAMAAIFAAGVRTAGYVKSFQSGGFTYTMDRNPDGGFTYRFLAIGGDNVHAKVVRVGGGIPGCSVIGNQFVVTGVGFRPTGAIGFHGSSIDTSGTGIDGAFNDGGGESMCVGWCDQSLQQYSLLAAATDGGTPDPIAGGDFQTRAYRALLSGSATGHLYTPGPISQKRLRIDGWDDDGFHGTGLDAPASTAMATFILIGGCSTVAGTFLQPAANGPMTVPIPGYVPLGVVLGSVGTTTVTPATGVETDESYCLGAFDGTRNHAYWHGARLGAIDSLALSVGGGANWGASDAAMQLARNNGSDSATIIEQGRFAGTGFSGSGFSGQWSGVDGVRRIIVYFAFVGVPGVVVIPPNLGVVCLVPLAPAMETDDGPAGLAARRRPEGRLTARGSLDCDDCGLH